MSPQTAKKEKPRLWKDFLGREAVQAFAKQIKSIYPSFASDKYTAAVLSDGFLNYELKQRIDRMAEALASFLPSDYSKAVKVLIAASPHVKSFENWVLTGYVEKFGLEHFDVSVKALAELTKFGTGEFAIRPFMIQHTRRMLPVLMKWTRDGNEHVRRLAAEGCRPRGVWTAHIDAFKKDPAPVFKILENLKSDESLYVRKAVANNLNDISKENPERVVAVARRWLKEGNERTDWIVKRGLRTLIKSGHRGALKVLGFDHKPSVKVKSFVIKPARVKIGGVATLILEMESSARIRQKVVVDYRVHYLKSKGTVSVRTFKWAEMSVGKSETVSLTRRNSFKNLSTRRHHPGEHLIEVLINGKASAKKSVRLL